MALGFLVLLTSLMTVLLSMTMYVIVSPQMNGKNNIRKALVISHLGSLMGVRESQGFSPGIIRPPVAPHILTH